MIEMGNEERNVEELEHDLKVAKQHMVDKLVVSYTNFIDSMKTQQAKWLTINGYMQAKNAILEVTGKFDSYQHANDARHVAGAMEILLESIVSYFAKYESEDESIVESSKKIADTYTDYLDKLYSKQLVKTEFDANTFAIELLIMQICQGIDDHWDRIKHFIEQAEQEIELTENAIASMKAEEES